MRTKEVIRRAEEELKFFGATASSKGGYSRSDRYAKRNEAIKAEFANLMAQGKKKSAVIEILRKEVGVKAGQIRRILNS